MKSVYDREDRSNPSASIFFQANKNTDWLFNHNNTESYVNLLSEGLNILSSTIQKINQPFSDITPEKSKKQFNNININQPLKNINDVLTELHKIYLGDAIYYHHPKYFAHYNCPVTIPSLLGEQLACALNTAVETWDQSSGGMHIEEHIVHWMCEKIGFCTTHADGVFTSGGTQSNLMGVLMAREHALNTKHKKTMVDGLQESTKKYRIYTSKASHCSVKKAAGIAGLGYQSVIEIHCDDHFRMDVLKLQEQLEIDRQEGIIPLAIIATAGTTDFSSIDPLEPISHVAKQYGAWFHVDAAYGGGLLLSERYKHKLAGIENSDSVTIDFHKSFYQPVCCSAFFVKEKDRLSVLTLRSSYLNPIEDNHSGITNLADKSIQTTRRLDALKLWLTLRTMGPEILSQYFNRCIDLASQIHHEMINNQYFEVLNKPEISVIVFRFIGGQEDKSKDLDRINYLIRKEVITQAQSMLCATKIDKKYYLKITILNPETTLEHIKDVIKKIISIGMNHINS